MIDINELRRLTQAAKNSCESGEWSHEFRSGRYSQGEIISGEENILIVCGANYGCWRDADDDGDSQFKALGDFVAAVNPAAVSELLDRLEAAESDGLEQARLNGMGASREAALLARLEAAEKAVTEAYQRGYKTGQEEIGKERDALRVEVERLTECLHRANAQAEHFEREWYLRGEEVDTLRAELDALKWQEPVAWMLNCQTLGGDTGWILSWTQSGAGLCNRLKGEENEKKLYTLPGAQGEEK